MEVRILKPTGPCNGIYLDFHGGAWVMGNARFNDRINSAIARECQMIVANVEYRLARDDRILPSIEDALAATVWTLENMRSEFGVDRAVLGGESSGAHLAACALTSLSLRQFDLSAVAGALFFYGTYDMAGTPSLRKSSGGALIMHGPSALKNLRRLTSGMDEAQRSAAVTAVL
ncbi:alpha/beta hydrolase [Sinorhizobium medicae]|uniref:alpha/beta hydrolase n=1 Tax=Sinorhizobium medicae TaxID=110321 RepID=UPI001F3BE12B|nr:alpha/beta hydrolase fold domain-containing protein [Sinorhizobium medicae]